MSLRESVGNSGDASMRQVSAALAGSSVHLEGIASALETLGHIGPNSLGWLVYGSPPTVIIRKTSIQDVVFVLGLPIAGATVRIWSNGHSLDLGYTATATARASFDALQAWLVADVATNLVL
jgi:hypothetical protein